MCETFKKDTSMHLDSAEAGEGVNRSSTRSFGCLVGLGVVQCTVILSILGAFNPAKTDQMLFADNSTYSRERFQRPTTTQSNFSNDIDTLYSGVEPTQQQDYQLTHLHADPVMAPIQQAGKMYSICRQDRSGSAIMDMLNAQAHALWHNVTYAGACCLKSAFPRKETVHLIQQLNLEKMLPFGCPDGIGPHLNLSPINGTGLSPLILNAEVYSKGYPHHFTAAWRETIHQVALDQANLVTLRPDRPFEIAVHVRRGDVSPCKHKHRYLPNAYYLALIDQYTPTKSERKNRPVRVTIFSESDSFEPFDAFWARNFTVELDTEDLATVWKAMAAADVVILPRSLFSFVPAIVNPNTVVMTPLLGLEGLAGWTEVDSAFIKANDILIDQMARDACDVEAEKKFKV